MRAGNKCMSSFVIVHLLGVFLQWIALVLMMFTGNVHFFTHGTLILANNVVTVVIGAWCEYQGTSWKFRRGINVHLQSLLGNSLATFIVLIYMVNLHQITNNPEFAIEIGVSICLALYSLVSIVLRWTQLTQDESSELWKDYYFKANCVQTQRRSVHKSGSLMNPSDKDTTQDQDKQSLTRSLQECSTPFHLRHTFAEVDEFLPFDNPPKIVLTNEATHIKESDPLKSLIEEMEEKHYADGLRNATGRPSVVFNLDHETNHDSVVSSYV